MSSFRLVKVAYELVVNPLIFEDILSSNGVIHRNLLVDLATNFIRA